MPNMVPIVGSADFLGLYVQKIFLENVKDQFNILQRLVRSCVKARGTQNLNFCTYLYLFDVSN